LKEMKIFFYSGIAFLAAGSFFVSMIVGSEQQLGGLGFVLGFIFPLIGIILIALALSSKNRSRGLGREDQTAKLSVSRTQLAIAILVTTVLFLGFLVYPGGLLYVAPNYPPYSMIEGLENRYKVRDVLAISFQTQWCRWDTEEQPQTTIRRIMDADGKVDNTTIWSGTVTLRTPPECADEYDVSLRTTYLEGTFKPLVLEKAGVYQIATEGDLSPYGEAKFRVVER
jgi:hypothetical protein